jgi:hypothetical protein
MAGAPSEVSIVLREKATWVPTGSCKGSFAEPGGLWTGWASSPEPFCFGRFRALMARNREQQYCNSQFWGKTRKHLRSAFYCNINNCNFCCCGNSATIDE